MNNDSSDLLSDALNDAKLLEKLNEVLEDKNSIINISMDDKNVIKIEEKPVIIEKANAVEKDEKKKSIVGKVLKSFYKIFETFVDNAAKTFLKKKYKINNSVYNDGKKAAIALCDKDTKTFFKKATDSLLNLFKKIPADTRKIIKNTKNVAIDEMYSWKVK